MEVELNPPVITPLKVSGSFVEDIINFNRICDGIGIGFKQEKYTKFYPNFAQSIAAMWWV
jgi:hypothetical protein